MSVAIDPIDALEQAAHRQSAECIALANLAKARTRLVLGKDAQSAFFATLAMKMRVVMDWNIPTAATDGKRLLINADFFNPLTDGKRLGLVAHEVLHVVLAHHARMGQRDMKRWNIAADAAINQILKESGFELPENGVMPGVAPFQDWPLNKSAEEYYSMIPGPQTEDGEGDGPGDDEGTGWGEVIKPGDGSEAAQRQAEAEAKIDVAQAAHVAKQRGKLPAGIARLVEDMMQPKVDWKNQLREFVNAFAKNDYAWFPPNRRFVHMGLYLPGLRSEELGEVFLAVDTSGSIGREELTRFASEMQGILDAYDTELTIIYHDSEVAGIQHWKSTDGPLVLEPKGGGGTSHECIFQWIEEQGKTPTCLVCLTDCYTSYPSAAPGYPVLWAVVGNDKASPPFGQMVVVE